MTLAISDCRTNDSYLFLFLFSSIEDPNKILLVSQFSNNLAKKINLCLKEKLVSEVLNSISYQLQ